MGYFWCINNNTKFNSYYLKPINTLIVNVNCSFILTSRFLIMEGLKRETCVNMLRVYYMLR